MLAAVVNFLPKRRKKKEKEEKVINPSYRTYLAEM